MSYEVVVLLSLLSMAFAWDGTCPDHVDTMPNFWPQNYLGDWYTTFDSYNGYIDETSACIRASYKYLSMFQTFQYLPLHIYYPFTYFHPITHYEI